MDGAMSNSKDSPASSYDLNFSYSMVDRYVKTGRIVYEEGERCEEKVKKQWDGGEDGRYFVLQYKKAKRQVKKAAREVEKAELQLQIATLKWEKAKLEAEKTGLQGEVLNIAWDARKAAQETLKGMSLKLMAAENLLVERSEMVKHLMIQDVVRVVLKDFERFNN